MSKKKTRPTSTAVVGRRSPEALRADLERRRSSAAARHTPAPRKGSRAARRASAIASAG